MSWQERGEGTASTYSPPRQFPQLSSLAPSWRDLSLETARQCHVLLLLPQITDQPGI